MLIMHEYLFEHSNGRGELLTTRIFIVNYDTHSSLSRRRSVNEIENCTSLSFNRVKISVALEEITHLILRTSTCFNFTFHLQFIL